MGRMRKRLRKGFGILVLAGLLCLTFAFQPPAESLGIVRFGNLQVRYPKHWRWIGNAPFPTYKPDPDCSCSEVPTATPLARIAAGADTLIFDTVHTILWSGKCFEPCYYAYRSHLAKGDLFALLTQNLDSRAAQAQAHHVHKVLPAALEQFVGGIPLYAMNGIYHSHGRSGIYFVGSASQIPVNLYGRFLHAETMEELYGVFESVKWVE
jgi:hypothetical protein